MAASRLRNPDLQVFINCPFDEDYWPLMKAMIFAIHACGFKARCSAEVDDQTEGRLEKIMRLMGECPLGIHDLSRNGLDSATGLARFNMPIELGIFLGADFFGKRRKRMLLMDARPRDYEKTASDLKGRDPRTHGNDEAKLIAHVRDWLNAQHIAGPLPGGREILRRYRLFQRDLRSMLRRFHLHESEISQPEHFIDWSHLVMEWLAQEG